jgi:hypothetical protein
MGNVILPEQLVVTMVTHVEAVRNVAMEFVFQKMKSVVHRERAETDKVMVLMVVHKIPIAVKAVAFPKMKSVVRVVMISVLMAVQQIQNVAEITVQNVKVIVIDI